MKSYTTTNKNIWMTGSEGMVGGELLKRGVNPLICDITKQEEVTEAVMMYDPEIIIHCAALTNVSYCENHEVEAIRVNVGGVDNIVNVFSGTLIYLSTDHVFNGKRLLGTYQEKHTADPVNIYGVTKFAGEGMAKAGRSKAIIVRTSKLFNHEMMKEDLDALKMGKVREYTNLIRRSFLYVPHFVNGLIKLLDKDLPHGEIVHIAGKEVMSYYGFWYTAAKIFGLDSSLVKSRNYKIEEAPRPFRGGLDTRKASRLGIPLYSALDGLEEIKNGERNII
jgi:dTDP-4-dehydrorhamnose reductase